MFCMNGIIQESTLERMEDIRGKPIRRGLDKAINECLDKLQDGTCKDADNKKVESEKVESEQADCLNNNVKRSLENG